MRHIILLLAFILFVGCTSADEDQVPIKLSVSKSNMAIAQTGGSEEIRITSAGKWKIECNVDWVTFSQKEGSGNQSVTVTILPNSGTDERSIIVKITDGKTNASISILQAGTNATLVVSPSTSDFNSAGGDFTVKVNAGDMEWEFEIPEAAKTWIALSEKKSTSVTFAIKLNNNKSKRNASLIFRLKGATANKTVVISQEPFRSSLTDKKWLSLALSQPASWYSTGEAKEIAENVLLYQKNAGGWPKNTEIHLILTDAEKAVIKSEKGSTDATKMACFDNDATTTELRFLAKMYKAVPDERYRTAFGKGMDFIIEAQYPNAGSPGAQAGGWPQFYPLRGGYSDRITFNDNLMTNILRLLREIYQDRGDFANIVEQGFADKAKASYDAGIRCILACQIVVGGVKTFWGAQHDEYTFDPVVGRPHELPSYSGAEGNDVLRFLMEIENPSQEIKDAVVAAVTWLESVKIPNKKVVDVKENGVTVDRVVQDSPGNDMWGRFIQLGGDVANRVYTKLFDDLKNSKRNTVINGASYSYNYGTNARASYNPANAYKPVYGIYDSDLGYLFYRFLYIFEDAGNAVDEQHGLSLPISSLNAQRRVSYQYLGNWPQNTIKNLYPAWKQKNGL